MKNRAHSGWHLRARVDRRKQSRRQEVLALRDAEKKHPIEEVGARLRGMMSWLHKDSKKTKPAQEPEPKVVNA
jgi:ketol-acid reductoisomerase